LAGIRFFSAGAASNNTGVGAGALALTTTGADDNTAVGSVAMFLNTGGHDNVAVGTAALLNNTSGNWNNAIRRLCAPRQHRRINKTLWARLRS